MQNNNAWDPEIPSYGGDAGRDATADSGPDTGPGPEPDPPCLEPSDEEVLQTGTNLCWRLGVEPAVTWFDAMNGCPEGYRVPTRQEYIDLLGGCDQDALTGEDSGEVGHCDPCLESADDTCEVLTEDEGLNYWNWSATTLKTNTDFAWVINFDSGEVTGSTKVSESYFRCVRGVS